MASQQVYKLIYWPGIPGRGEFIRLAFEYAKHPYEDVSDVKRVVSLKGNPDVSGVPPHFAPPMLELSNGKIISQTASILSYLAPKLGLAPSGTGDDDDIQRTQINQLLLTALDINDESHNAHHPICPRLYYEDQKVESIRYSEEFRNNRLPSWLGYFQKVVQSNSKETGTKGYTLGSSTTTADLALFHVMTGLEFAFPKKMAALKQSGKYDDVWALKDRVANEPNIAAYLKSERRRPFSDGIFRYYAELDGE